ncbi:spore coat U domain-containing protein [soil metagenome]
MQSFHFYHLHQNIMNAIKSNTARRAALALTVVLMASAAQVSNADAATATASMPISATVLSYCTITALPLPFGNYSTAQVDASSSVSVLCTTSTAYSVGLDAGTGAGATIAARKMTVAAGTDVLSYSLYLDSTRTSVWGTTVGTNTKAGTGSGLLQNIPVYGRVAANQSPTPGVYTDTVTVTLTY